MNYKQKMEKVAIRFMKERLPNYYTLTHKTDILDKINSHLTGIGSFFYEDIVSPKYRKDNATCVKGTFSIEDYFIFLSQYEWYLDFVTRTFEEYLQTYDIVQWFINVVNKNRKTGIRPDFFKNIRDTDDIKTIKEYVQCVIHENPLNFIGNAITSDDLIVPWPINWFAVNHNWMMYYGEKIHSEIEYADNR